MGQACRQDGVGACFGAGTQMPNVPMFGPQLFPNFGSHPGVGQVDLASGVMGSNLNGSAMGQNPSGSWILDSLVLNLVVRLLCMILSIPFWVRFHSW